MTHYRCGASHEGGATGDADRQAQRESGVARFGNTDIGRGVRHSGHAGAEIKVSKPMEDKNPLVLGRLGRNPDVPTVTFYGHYDVQPAMEREWATNPFEIAAIDGYLYGRGTSDNKVRAPRTIVTDFAILHSNIELHALWLHQTDSASRVTLLHQCSQRV